MPLLTVNQIDDPEFQLPATTSDPMYEVVQRPVVADLTSGTVGGAGIFDKLMAGMSAHLEAEYDKGRIMGAEYTKAYIELTQAVLNASIQFSLGREAAFWTAQNGQVQSVAGRIDMESKRVAYATNIYTYDNILPQQKNLIAEQANVARAQTFDYRFDEGTGGDPVFGLIGKQKDLYSEQIVSYRKDAQTKAGKIFADTWITQKTVDEGLAAPTNFVNSTLDTVFNAIRTANSLT